MPFIVLHKQHGLEDWRLAVEAATQTEVQKYLGTLACGDPSHFRIYDGTPCTIKKQSDANKWTFYV